MTYNLLFLPEVEEDVIGGYIPHSSFPNRLTQFFDDGDFIAVGEFDAFQAVGPDFMR
jgi:hypothetical protein